MYFDFTALNRFIWLSLFRTRRHHPLTLKRFFIIMLFLGILLPLELFSWFFFAMDRLSFPGITRRRLKQPVFILGNFRSGTTFLHRLMLKDEARFHGMKMWEIVFAPSIVQRMAIRGISIVDRFIGRPLQRLLTSIENRTLKEVDFHHYRLDSYEEDEAVLIHGFSTMLLWLYSAPLPSVGKHIHFTRDLSQARRRRIMRMYRMMLQRHMYHHQDRAFLSKSPMNTPKIEDLQKEFPDAKFILLVRDPMEVIPSQMNMMQFGWRAGANPAVEYPWKDEVLDMTEHWYRYPLEAFPKMDPSSYMIVDYAKLRENPKDMVESIYRNLGMDMSEDYRAVLEKEMKKARSHKHTEYPFERMNLDAEEIRKRYAFVYEEYDLQT